MFSLIHFAEAEKHLMNHATFREVAEVVKNYFLCQKRMMAITPLQAWSQSRWIDMALSVAWVIENASPTVADGKLYAPREDGVIMVAAISDGFKFLSENNMGERIIASPVPVNSRLLLRGEKPLICIKP